MGSSASYGGPVCPMGVPVHPIWGFIHPIGVKCVCGGPNVS